MKNLKYFLWFGLFTYLSTAKSQTAAYKKINDLILEGSVAASSSSGRESIEKRGNDDINQIDMENSSSLLSPLLEKDPENANLNYKMGVTYFFSFDQQLKALPYLKKAIKKVSRKYDFYNDKESMASPNAFYFLGNTLFESGQPDSALKYFAMYQDLYLENPLSTEREISMCMNAREGIKKPRNVQISNIGNAVNSTYAETNPVMRLDNQLLFFSSRRPIIGNEIGKKSGIADANIYYVLKNTSGQWDNVQPFPFNTMYDEAPLYLTPNGDVLYFRKTIGNNTDIFRSTLVNGKWLQPVPVNEINSPANETGFSATADGKCIYYSSDQNKPGKYDLFRCVKNKNNRWNTPELLSSSINTPFNEVSPYISPDGSTLFFSSDGSSRQGMGNFDIYYSQLVSEKWTEPATMGFPINKCRADINYYVSGNDKRYYSTLTEENSYDIFLIEGGGFDFESIAAGIDVITVTNEMGVTQVMETEKSVEKEVEVAQAVETIVEKEKEVEVIKAVEIEKEKEVPLARDADLLEQHLGITGVRVSDVNVENLSVEERNVLVEKVKAYLSEQLMSNESVKFKTVYFDFNKSNLNLLSLNELKLLVEFLGEHPETKIEIAGHGDNKGSWDTNLQLSNKRAREVYDFLISNKVSADRMFFYGKGSAVPIAPNDTEDNRGKNRRVEVFILK